jgi:hypothetical protein
MAEGNLEVLQPRMHRWSLLEFEAYVFERKLGGQMEHFPDQSAR